jgi:hypothetical protein
MNTVKVFLAILINIILSTSVNSKILGCEELDFEWKRGNFYYAMCIDLYRQQIKEIVRNKDNRLTQELVSEIDRIHQLMDIEMKRMSNAPIITERRCELEKKLLKKLLEKGQSREYITRLHFFEKVCE